MTVIEKIIVSLAIIIVGIAIGKALNKMCLGKSNRFVATLEKWLDGMTKISLVVFNPFVLIGVFWIVDVKQTSLYYLPVIGVLCLVLGGLFALGFAKALKLDRMKTGSMFASGTFYNWGSYGTLFCFMILGQQSLVYVIMIRLLEELIYYTVVFPMAKTYGVEQGEQIQKQSKLRVLADPFILSALLAILIGGALNFSPLDRPEFYELLINIIVPLAILLLVIPVGYRMQFMAIQHYLKESFAISIVKFILVPVCIVSIAYGLGLGKLDDGMVMKTILIMSVMPQAFMSLIPPKLYGLDVNLANSSWIVNTGMLVIVLPIVYVIIQFM